MTAYSSSEAAQMLSIAPTTLRKLSNAFAAWLSSSAAGTMAAGEIEDCFYNDDDLEALRYIIVLLKQNRNYAWVRQRLAAEYGVVEHMSADDEADGAELEQPASNQGPPVLVIDVSEPQQPAQARAAHIAEPIAFELEYGATNQAPDLEEAEMFEAADAPEQSASDARYVVDAEVVEPDTPVPPDIAAMLARIAELYQELLRNKDQEIIALRQALDVTELSAANERRELEMLNRLTKMMERENQRMTVEIEEMRRQLGQGPARRGWFARLFGGGNEESSSAQQV
jgi:hypothetical protein